MKLIVGLGNPGDKYARNRHNVGFMAVDEIHRRHGFPAWRRRFQGVTAEAEIAGERCLLLKPATYMNESGLSVGEAARFLKIAIGDIVVVYDEIDLAPGKLKVKTGGGNAGHNGLRSISAHLGNDYVRVRIGVGHPGVKELVAHWVLHDFAKADGAWLDPLLTAIAEEAGYLATGDHARFLSAVAKAIAPADEDDAANPARQPRRKPDDTGPARPAPAAVVKSPGGALADKLASWLGDRKKS